MMIGLIGYEIRKILKRRSTWLAFLALFAIQIMLGFSGYLNMYHTGETPAMERECAEVLSQKTLDDSMIAEIREAYAKIDVLGEGYKDSENYAKEILPYERLYSQLRRAWLQEVDGDVFVDAQSIYSLRKKQQEALWDHYGLSETERAYWKNQEEALPERFTYSYAPAYECFVDMSGCYMTSMLVTFFIAVCMVGVFTEENSHKTDQLILCTKNGRGMLYAAKLIAGSSIVLVVTVLMIGVYLLGHLLFYGAGGAESMFQTAVAFCDSRNMTIGQAALIMVVLLVLSSLMIGVFAMILAQLLHHMVGAMAILVGSLFAARLVMIPVSWGLASKLWNLIPINLLKVDQGFMDLRLFRVLGVSLTSYQFAPVVYVSVTLAVILVGKRAYCHMQIKGQ